MAGLMRSLGQFVGHIAKAVKTDVSSTERREVSRTVEEEERETEGGKVTLRRTVIEEIEVEKPREE
ncbi:MAG: hypothetical protein EA423_00245 [Phycisphaerales bacterium]|nr:hypothetical protein [Phycisphaerales bacterium]TVS09306.1 MAG: hypothetical protein EA423_00245 [Phycisphaerales bacterium]